MNEEPDRLAILEALLFVAEEPLPLPKLQEVLADGQPSQTEVSLRELSLRLEEDGRGLMVQEVAGGFRLTTRPETHAWVQKLQQVKPARLSRPALETLAIVAYRQPITRAEIEAIRGVAVDGVMRTLLERGLVRMMGRKAEAGRPMLYGTSAQFLEQFGLKNLGDLPTLREINELINAPEGEAVAGAAVDPDQPVEESAPAAVDPEQPIEDSLLVAVDLEQSVGRESSPAAGDLERILEEGPALTVLGPDQPVEESAPAAVDPEQPIEDSLLVAVDLEQSVGRESSPAAGDIDQSAEVESAPAAEPAEFASGGGPATEAEPGKASTSRPA
ncbi:MAG: SMC-Scp complex subunit ScpB [candidate division NC10 bacterium]